jgi:hypothetical protein
MATMAQTLDTYLFLGDKDHNTDCLYNRIMNGEFDTLNKIADLAQASFEAGYIRANKDHE